MDTPKIIRTKKKDKAKNERKGKEEEVGIYIKWGVVRHYITVTLPIHLSKIVICIVTALKIHHGLVILFSFSNFHNSASLTFAISLGLLAKMDFP